MDIYINNRHWLQNIFIFCLFMVLVISIYFFIDVMVLKNKTHMDVFSNWQFPMIFALFLDTLY